MNHNLDHPVRKPDPAYAGDGSFVFVSYSHKDMNTVGNEIAFLQENQVNVWYYEGIESGSEWSDSIANAISSAT